MSLNPPKLFVAVFCGALLTLLACLGAAQANTESRLSNQERIALAAGYFHRSQLPSGLFPYDLNFATGVAADMSDMDGMNIVRQAAAGFALSEYYAAHPSRDIHNTLSRLLSALANRSLPISRGTIQSALEEVGLYNRWQLWHHAREPLNAMGLLYSTEGPGELVSANGTYERAWPGATALALLAELNYSATSGDNQFADMRHRWAEGLAALHVPDRGIREAPHYVSESPLVNGETWLALAMYAHRHPEIKGTHNILSELETYVLKRYTDKPVVLFYHWGAMAAAERARITGERRFTDFLTEQTALFLGATENEVPSHENRCWRVEGLASFLLALANVRIDAQQIAERVRERIHRTMGLALNLQLRPSQKIIELSDGTRVSSGKISEAAGAFLTSSDSAAIRVDITGHCLSALLRMERAGLSKI